MQSAQTGDYRWEAGSPATGDYHRKAGLPATGDTPTDRAPAKAMSTRDAAGLPLPTFTDRVVTHEWSGSADPPARLRSTAKVGL